MTDKQIKLLTDRMVKTPQRYNGIEPYPEKEKHDKIFCMEFFSQDTPNLKSIKQLLDEAIDNKNELELNLLLMLIEHFAITEPFDLIIAPLLIQSWHHLHDRIAKILENDHNVQTIEYLRKGATYRCKNLEYECNYCEFNRKCLFALLKIGTPKSISIIKEIANCENQIIANHAKTIIRDYNI